MANTLMERYIRALFSGCHEGSRIDGGLWEGGSNLHEESEIYLATSTGTLGSFLFALSIFSTFGNYFPANRYGEKGWRGVGGGEGKEYRRPKFFSLGRVVQKPIMLIHD